MAKKIICWRTPEEQYDAIVDVARSEQRNITNALIVLVKEAIDARKLKTELDRSTNGKHTRS